jgi:lipopolysaccharide export system ATP-binding protein
VELAAEHLVKVYRRRRVVNEGALHGNQGEVVGLLGPNGAGKTTTFYMVVGLVRPTSGRILLEGEDITALPMYRRAQMGIGYLAQEPSVFRRLTTRQNIELVLQLLKMSKQDRRRRLTELLEEFDLAARADQQAQSLSGGERRRLELARTLATSPKFILLDEPFTGVDPLAIQAIQNTVRDLKNRGIGVLITDHNVRETLAITDRAYILSHGRIMTSGTSEELVNDPAARKFYLGDEFEM